MDSSNPETPPETPPESQSPSPGSSSTASYVETPGEHRARTPRKVQWPDEQPDESPSLDEKGLHPERFQKLAEALEKHRRTRPLQKVHYYPPDEPVTPPTQDVPAEDTSTPSKDTEPDSMYPTTPSRATTFSPAEPSRRVPDNYIDEHEDAGLPGTKDLRDYAIGKAEHVSYLPVKLYRTYESPSPSSSAASSRRSSFDGYNTPSDQEEKDTARLSRRMAKRKGERVYDRQRWHCEIPNIFGHVARPAATKSAGGVFGPLIASTGNLIGPLQPNLKRPGYSLSRYSMETVDIPPPRPRPPMLPRRHTSDYAGSAPPSEATGTPTNSPSDDQRPFYRQGAKANLSGLFGDYYHAMRGRRSGYTTPTERGKRSPSHGGHRQRRKRKDAEVYITRHVAQIIRREEFIMKLTRAMMMFGAPTHRLQSQIQSAAHVLDLKLSFLYLPDIVLLSFDDNTTGTSHIKLIRQASVLDLEKLKEAFALYWKVIHDQLLVSDASAALDELMKKQPLYGWWPSLFIGGMCSASICTVSFGGSFIDAVVSFPFGALLVAVQILSVRNILYSHIFEVTITTLFAFISAALSATHKLCYPAVTSSAVVLILPGFLVLTGSLELMSRHIISGSVHLCFAVVYALFLGFGFTIGAELFEIFTGHHVYGAEDYMCNLTHSPHGAWYQRTPSVWWAFLTVPMFSLFLSLRNRCPYNKKELPLLIIVSCVGWVVSYFAGRRFRGQSDINAAVGSFAIGLISNLYSRIFSGNAFVVMITGILFQLPSGLGSGGLLSYASQQASGYTNSYLLGFQTALKLVSVAVGITIGLGLSLVLTHPIQSRKREAGIFSL
ncbi:hypothetical protein BJ912DRAFT_955497 [Pholiota molesta]|nr:hypothetical protein BJ912DRAFT_955497 [Pholiota molesta]